MRGTGDILWYLASIAGKAGLDLEEIAAANLAKVPSRWDGVVSGDLLSRTILFEGGDE